MMTDNTYAAIAGAILSLAFFYVPGLKDWYEKLVPEKKQWIMLACLFVAVAGRFALSCVGRDSVFVCDTNGAIDAVMTFIWSVVASAGVYKAINYIAIPGKGKG